MPPLYYLPMSWSFRQSFITIGSKLWIFFILAILCLRSFFWMQSIGKISSCLVKGFTVVFEFQPKKIPSPFENIEDQRRAETELSITESKPEIQNPHKNDLNHQKPNENQHPGSSNDLRREENLDEIVCLEKVTVTMK